MCTGTRSIFPLFPPYRPKLDEAKQACPSSQASLKKKSNGSELRATRRYRPRLSMGTTRFAIGPIPKQLQRVYCHTLDFPPISPYRPPIAPAQPVYTVYTQSGTGVFLIWTPEFSTDSLHTFRTQNQPISRPAYEVSGRSAKKVVGVVVVVVGTRGDIYLYRVYIGRLLSLTYEKMPLRAMEAAYGLQNICPFG